jgi:hypothetical protein
METWVMQAIIIVPLAFMLTLPFTYKWVSARKKYFARLNSMRFDENEKGLIIALEGTPKPSEFIFSPNPDTSKNPGLVYTVATQQEGVLLINSIVSIYYYLVYKKRIWRQRGFYNREQLILIEQVEKSDGDCSHLRSAFAKAFLSPSPPHSER